LTKQADATHKAKTKGGYDLTGVVVSSAVKSATGDAVVLMVAADSSRVGTGGSQVTPIRYEVTMTKSGGAWVASQLQALPSQ